MVLSLFPPPVAKVLDFQGHQLIALTAPLWPLRAEMGKSFLMSQISTLQSLAPDANMFF